MKLFQVRKGQFVYYENELHRVYAVKPMYKKSVHLIRLRDLTQHLSSAAEVERYQPKELDSFIFNKKVYTLSKDRRAEVGDYILITNPTPDYLDHYSLNEIEVVATVENKGVITNNSNGIRHHEYLLMVPGRHEKSNPIEYRDKGSNEDIPLNGNESENIGVDDLLPIIGDVYKKNDKETTLEAMVIGIEGSSVFLGNGQSLHQDELMDTEKWLFLYHLGDK
ncbi:hypothetical protein H9636_09730 [Ureibacillus sp. Re31]|uniref:Uncharacterized protein n=1 Tax=Ureibacillus galli TaxID=2762222 RepID=A0ABR8XCI5_9BACL|nr:hypothetical protein [Ureibacillus galli]MBD8026939.1 hypothetical protein [Ureibacillus galli]